MNAGLTMYLTHWCRLNGSDRYYVSVLNLKLMKLRV